MPAGLRMERQVGLGLRRPPAIEDELHVIDVPDEERRPELVLEPAGDAPGPGGEGSPFRGRAEAGRLQRFDKPTLHDHAAHLGSGEEDVLDADARQRLRRKIEVEESRLRARCAATRELSHRCSERRGVAGPPCIAQVAWQHGG
ncbi:MAG TPA: hypothetical protein VIL25_01150, partial [Vicinamibacterales bacterium]